MRLRDFSLTLLIGTIGLAASAGSASATWTAPTQAIDRTAQLGTPQIAFAPDGTTTLVYLNGTTGTQAITSRERTPAGAWSAPVTVQSGTTQLTGLRVATETSGRVTALWIRYLPSGSVLETSTKAPGASWSAPTPVSASAPTDYTNDVDLVVAPDGRAIAAWRTTVGMGNAQVLTIAVRTAAGVWQTPTSLPEAGREAFYPAAAFLPSGEALVAWVDQPSGINQAQQIKARTAPFGGTWSTGVGIGTSTTAPKDHTRLVVEPDGTVDAAWNQYDPVDQKYHVFAALRSPGGVWTTPIDLVSPGGFSTLVDLDVDAAGNATATITRSGSGPPTSGQVITKPSGGQWQVPATNLSDPAKVSSAATVAVAPSGPATAVWASGPDYAIARRASAAGAWFSGPPIVAPAGEPLRGFTLALDPLDDPVVVWTHAPTVNVFSTGPALAQLQVDDTHGPALTDLSVPLSEAGAPAVLHVNSQDLWSPGGSTSWTFGDGGTATGTTVRHAWAAPGSYAVSVSSTDGLGNASSKSTTVTVLAPPPVNKTDADRTKPRIGALKLKQRKLKTTVSEPATVRLRIYRQSFKRVKGKLKKVYAKKATKTIKATPRKAGSVTLTINKKTPKGTYRFVVTATDAAGNSATRQKTLTLK